MSGFIWSRTPKCLPASPPTMEGAADQMLSGMLEFLELLAVPLGYLPVEVPHDVAIDQHRNGCRLPWIARYHGGQVPVEPVTPGPGSGDCLAQCALEPACTDDGGNFCAPAAAVHGPVVVVGLMGHARVFEFSR